MINELVLPQRPVGVVLGRHAEGSCGPSLAESSRIGALASSPCPHSHCVMVEVPFHDEQVKFGDSELAGESLDEEGVAVFRLRGLSLLAAPSAHAHLSHSSSTSSVPSRTGRLGGKFWPFQSSAKDGTPQSPHCLLHVIAPSKGDAAEWKAALEVLITHIIP